MAEVGGAEGSLAQLRLDGRGPEACDGPQRAQQHQWKVYDGANELLLSHALLRPCHRPVRSTPSHVYFHRISKRAFDAFTITFRRGAVDIRQVGRKVCSFATYGAGRFGYLDSNIKYL